MLFSSLSFLYYFLPLAVFFYFIVQERWRNLTLLVISLFFYAWGEPIYVIVLLISASVDYHLARFIERCPKQKKKGLYASIGINLSLLIGFKYLPWIIDLMQLDSISFPFSVIAMPIGISFYTFQTMSYTIDVYRGKVSANHNFISFAMYVSMFPQLIAGPIVRYRDVKADLFVRNTSFDMCEKGITRFIYGLAKKVLLANAMGQAFEQFRVMDASILGSWLMIVAYAFHIYFDFSGYSDMAIGLGNIFGFHFPENFNYPYMAKSLHDFWRRWHISLSTWLKDYVYLPLGGNQHPIRNMLLVWSACGLWHGAGLNFLLWGLYFGGLLILEKYVYGSFVKCLPNMFQHLLTIVLILIGWMIFVMEDPAQYEQFLRTLTFQKAWVDNETLYLLRNYSILFSICAIGSVPIVARLKQYIVIPIYVRQLFVFGLLILCTAYLSDATYNPFIYFRF